MVVVRNVGKLYSWNPIRMSAETQRSRVVTLMVGAGDLVVLLVALTVVLLVVDLENLLLHIMDRVLVLTLNTGTDANWDRHSVDTPVIGSLGVIEPSQKRSQLNLPGLKTGQEASETAVKRCILHMRSAINTV